MDLAVARADEVEIAGLAVDWSKCYDRLRLSVLKSIAAAAGLPGSISGPMLAAYGQARRVLCEGMAGALRVPNCGLAPGCPAATDWLAMLMFPWLVKAREAKEEEERRCRAYVDDLTAWAKGRGRVEAVNGMVEDTDEFGRDAGLVPHARKCRRFATDVPTRCELALTDGPPVSDWFGDLGVVQVAGSESRAAES